MNLAEDATFELLDFSKSGKCTCIAIMFLLLCCQALCCSEAEKLPCQLGEHPGDRVEISSLGRLSVRAFLSVFAGICHRVPSHSCLFPWQPSLFPLFHPSTCKCWRPSGESPRGPWNATGKVSACRWGWPQHHVHLEKAARSFIGEGKTEPNHSWTARTHSSSSSVNAENCWATCV